MNLKVYISYSQKLKDQPNNIIELLISCLKKNKIQYIIDVEEVGYKDDIVEFMKEIGKGEFIILIINDSYLKSKYCMFEVCEISKNEDYMERIFPIVISGIEVDNLEKMYHYVEYWDLKHRSLTNFAQKEPINFAYLIESGILDEIDLFDQIKRTMPMFIKDIRRVYTLTESMHKNSDFAQLVKKIEERHKYLQKIKRRISRSEQEKKMQEQDIMIKKLANKYNKSKDV